MLLKYIVKLIHIVLVPFLQTIHKFNQKLMPLQYTKIYHQLRAVLHNLVA